MLIPVQTVNFLTFLFDPTLQTSKKADLVGVDQTVIRNLDGEIIGTSGMLFLGDDSVTHVITDADGNLFSFDDNSTPESRQISIWEHRDHMKETEAGNIEPPEKKDKSEAEASEKTGPEGESKDEKDGQDKEEAEPDPDGVPVLQASIDFGPKSVELNIMEPTFFVFEE